MNWTEEHERLATAKRIAHLYSDNRLGQAAIEGVILLGDFVDKINAQADKLETERRTKLYYEQLKKEQEVAINNKPSDGEGPAAAVNVDHPIKPIAPAKHEIPVEAFDERLVHRTQRLEIPAYKAEIPFFEVKKEYEVFKPKVYEVKQKTFEFKNEISLRQDKGIKIE